MQLTLELITKGFVSSFEEEEYEFTKIFYNNPDLEDEEEDEDENRDKSNQEINPDDEREIFDDDSSVIRELF